MTSVLSNNYHEVRVILYVDPNSFYEDKWNQKNNKEKVLNFKGQNSRKTMDNYFKRPNTTFYIFKKHNKEGWIFMGKGFVKRNIHERSKDVPPVWEISYDNDDIECSLITRIITNHQADNHNKKHVYLTKRVLYELLNIEPRIKALEHGIIPFTYKLTTADVNSE